MPYITYVPKNFSAGSQRVIAQAADICREYQQAGYDLTLRQLYYQFVARGLIPNKQSEYKRLGSIINDARLAGELDWNWLIDRTRNLNQLPSWAHPRSIILAAAQQFHLDWWEDQPFYTEVWVEKEALAGVIEQTCDPMSVPTLACRGYMSQSEQWAAARRFVEKIKNGQTVRVIHLGDHDPSGIDMTRDNLDRLTTFVLGDLLSALGAGSGTFSSIADRLDRAYGVDSDRGPAFDVDRIALTWDQVQEYQPPPNPAKTTDARYADYEAQYGDESWELDALPPDVLAGLITDAVEGYMDEERMEAVKVREGRYRNNISALLAAHGDVLDRDVDVD